MPLIACILGKWCINCNKIELLTYWDLLISWVICLHSTSCFVLRDWQYSVCPQDSCQHGCNCTGTILVWKRKRGGLETQGACSGGWVKCTCFQKEPTCPVWEPFHHLTGANCSLPSNVNFNLGSTSEMLSHSWSNIVSLFTHSYFV